MPRRAVSPAICLILCTKIWLGYRTLGSPLLSSLKSGLTASQYFRSNLLGDEVLVSDVARAFLNLAQAEKTSGNIFTVDGGNIAAAPR